MFRRCSTCKDHNLLCMSPCSRGKKKIIIKNPSLNICQASTRVAGASDKILSYFTSSGKHATARNTVSKLKDRILEEAQFSSTLPIREWHDDSMKSTAKYFWGRLQERQMALFRSSCRPGPISWLNGIKNLLFSIWNPTSDQSNISTTKGYMLRGDKRQTGFCLISLQLSNEINM